MIFDFRARAAQREKKATDERRRERELQEKRFERIAILESSFLHFAQGELYRNGLKADRKGPVVTFTDGDKMIQVTAENATTFRWVDTGKTPGQTRVGTGMVHEGVSESDLMDALDSWARRN